MEGYREQNTRLWRLKLENEQKKEDKLNQCIINDGNDQYINAVLPEINIREFWSSLKERYLTQSITTY